eukprot:g3333.t1
METASTHESSASSHHLEKDTNPTSSISVGSPTSRPNNRLKREPSVRSHMTAGVGGTGKGSFFRGAGGSTRTSDFNDHSVSVHVPTHHVTTTIIRHSGYLQKANPLGRGWKERWFVLDGRHQTLAYYTSRSSHEKGKSYKGCIDLADERTNVLPNSDPNKKPPSKRTHESGFRIETYGRTYYLHAKNAEDKAEWYSALARVQRDAKQLRDTAASNEASYNTADPNSNPGAPGGQSQSPGQRSAPGSYHRVSHSNTDHTSLSDYDSTTVGPTSAVDKTHLRNPKFAINHVLPTDRENIFQPGNNSVDILLRQKIDQLAGHRRERHPDSADFIHWEVHYRPHSLTKPKITKFETKWSKHESLTVSKMKENLQIATGLDKKRISLSLNGVMLDDEWTGADFGLFDGAILQMTFISKADYRKQVKSTRRDRNAKREEWLDALEKIRTDGGKDKDQVEMKSSDPAVEDAGRKGDSERNVPKKRVTDGQVLELSLEVDGKVENFTYSLGNDPYVSATTFCQRHNLGKEEVELLVSQINNYILLSNDKKIQYDVKQNGGVRTNLSQEEAVALQKELVETKKRLAESEEALSASRRFNDISLEGSPRHNKEESLLAYTLRSAVADPLQEAEWVQEKRMLLHAANADRKVLLEENRILREMVLRQDVTRGNEILETLEALLKPIRDGQKQDLNEIRKLQLTNDGLQKEVSNLRVAVLRAKTEKAEWNHSTEKKELLEKWSEETDALTDIIEAQKDKQKKVDEKVSQQTDVIEQLKVSMQRLQKENEDLAKALQSTARRLLLKE